MSAVRRHAASTAAAVVGLVADETVLAETVEREWTPVSAAGRVGRSAWIEKGWDTVRELGQQSERMAAGPAGQAEY